VNIHQFIEQFKQLEPIQKFIHQTEKAIYCKNLIGSQLSLLIHQYSQKPEFHKHIVICSDKERAFYLFDELRRLNEARFQYRLYYFPATFKRPYEIEEIDNANVLRRTEVLTQLHYFQQENSPEPLIIVSYSEALFDLVIQSKELSKNSIKIQAG
jgi:transcription-repair coupling factor (superfamily II helicase)